MNEQVLAEGSEKFLRYCRQQDQANFPPLFQLHSAHAHAEKKPASCCALQPVMLAHFGLPCWRASACYGGTHTLWHVVDLMPYFSNFFYLITNPQIFLKLEQEIEE